MTLRCEPSIFYNWEISPPFSPLWVLSELFNFFTSAWLQFGRVLQPDTITSGAGPGSQLASGHPCICWHTHSFRHQHFCLLSPWKTVLLLAESKEVTACPSESMLTAINRPQHVFGNGLLTLELRLVYSVWKETAVFSYGVTHTHGSCPTGQWVISNLLYEVERNTEQT